MQVALTVSALETLTDELCEIDHYWEQSKKVEKSIMVPICPYSAIVKERKTKSEPSILHALLKKNSGLGGGGDPQPVTSSEQ
jgi:hypothetical protein